MAETAGGGKKVRKYVIKTKVDSGNVNSGHNWWAEPDDKISGAIFNTLKSLHSNQSMRMQNLLRCGRLYANRDISSFIPGQSSLYSTRMIAFNVCKMCVDTVSAKIAKINIRPLFLTTRGDFSQQRRAQKLSQYILGQFESSKVFELQQKAFLHAAVYDLGVVKVWPDKIAMQPRAEVVHPHELIVDEVEAADGNPRSIYHTKLLPRSVVYGMVQAMELEDKEKKLDAVMSATTAGAAGMSLVTMTDLIPVVEAFHLPSVPGADDGKRVLTLENQPLLVEEWPHDFFPFVFHRWSPGTVGFYGDGLVSQLIPIQLEINLTAQRIQESQQLYAVPRIFIETSSQISPSAITNELGSIVLYTGTPPVFSNPQAANPEIYQYLQTLENKALEYSGISQLSAQSVLPRGLDSGKALRVYQDVETERFSLVSLRWQNSFVELAKLFVWAARELYQIDSKLSVAVKGRGFISKIAWKECDLEDDKFVISVEPTSMLSTRPEGKLQQVSELYQLQIIDKDQFLSLLDFPDLDAHSNLALAADDDLKFIMERMLDGEYIGPEPYMKLDAGIKLMNSFYLRSRSEKVPDEIRELALTWISQAQEMVQKAQMEEMQRRMQIEQAANPQPPVEATPAGAAPAEVAATPEEQMMLG